MADCPACDGKGKRQVFDVHFLYGDWSERDCPDCDATGKIDDPVQHAKVKKLIGG